MEEKVIGGKNKQKEFFMKKAVLGLFVVIGLLFVACGDYKTFVQNDGTLIIEDYRGKDKNPVIPDTIKGKKVTGISISTQGKNDSFTGKQLTGVTIPNSITYIGGAAFENNKLTSVTIPDSVIKLEGGAFQNNQLTSVIISNSITEIQNATFRKNQLTSVTIPNSVTKIYISAFSNNLLTSVTIPNSVTYIDESAFSRNQLTSIIIPNSVTYIGKSAFSNNQLTSVTIPNSVTDIGESAFSNNQLTSVTIPNSITYIRDSVFSNNQLTSVIITNKVYIIGDNAFYNNQLTSLTIPKNVSEIRKNAFSKNKLTRVNIQGYGEIFGDGRYSHGVKIYGNSFDKEVLINGKTIDKFRNLYFNGIKDNYIGKGNLKTEIDMIRNVLTIPDGGYFYIFDLLTTFNNEKHTTGIMRIKSISNRQYFESAEVETNNGKYRFHRNDTFTFEIIEGEATNTMKITLGNGQTYNFEEDIRINRKD